MDWIYWLGVLVGSVVGGLIAAGFTWALIRRTLRKLKDGEQ